MSGGLFFVPDDILRQIGAKAFDLLRGIPGRVAKHFRGAVTAEQVEAATFLVLGDA